MYGSFSTLSEERMQTLGKVENVYEGLLSSDRNSGWVGPGGGSIFPKFRFLPGISILKIFERKIL